MDASEKKVPIRRRFTYHGVAPLTLAAALFFPVWEWLREFPQPHEVRREYRDMRKHQRVELLEGGYDDPSEGRGAGWGGSP